ncbi:amino acid ABC transporter permease [Bradyrhizobium diazoefficiens]|uniref:amino acid ABC transporter permease n=1 Tax=Bradyrhizobium diazoefficiens TaxID=1355477 RepID=UPI00190A5A9E|nr:amino acid ABC transporter permease [Bradyrhizobium diazoefficiens]QQO16745.1 amino acid ABC transporter permease [Bradyrhizobium diazoefficiens]
MFQGSLSWNDVLLMLQGAGVTLAITFWAVLGGTILGLVFGVVRASAARWVQIVLGAFLEIFRSVPLLIQLVLINSFSSIAKFGLPPFKIACITLAIYTAAYCAEIVRSGVLAVPQTTRRAARSLGLTRCQDLMSIVLPIATRVMLPSWIGLVLAVMKDTALVLWIGIAELLRTSQTIVTRTQEPLLVLAIAGLIYFAMSFPIARVGGYLERKWQMQ